MNKETVQIGIIKAPTSLQENILMKEHIIKANHIIIVSINKIIQIIIIPKYNHKTNMIKDKNQDILIPKC